MSLQPEAMTTDDLGTACQRESSKFFRNEPTDDRFCYELFRRALKYRNNYAWENIWATYRNLVSGWVRISGAEQTNTPIDELILLSFEKFWHAFSTTPFDHFLTLPALLQYLRMCCASTVTDRLRRRKQDQFLMDLDSAFNLEIGSKPDRIMLEEERARFWELVAGMLNDEQERLLMRTLFMSGLRPNQIHDRYPDSFPTVHDVYRVKRNIMNRMRRSGDLRDFWDF